MLEEAEIVLKSFQPTIDGWGNPAEMFIVSFLPQTPSSHQEDVKEERAPPGIFSLLKKLEAAGEGGPISSKFLPAGSTERASENHMIHRLLVMGATEQTTVIISYIIVSMLEHVTCV